MEAVLAAPGAGVAKKRKPKDKRNQTMKLAGAYINDDTYGRLVKLAAANNRTLAGQCRHLFDRALRGELQVPDASAQTPLVPPVMIHEAVPVAGKEGANHE